MADFNKAYKRIEKAEGGYVNDPDDKGGETYKGISRKYHQDSEIWKIIDDIKIEHGTKGLTSILAYNERLQKLVKEIYKKEYWDVFKLDTCPSQGMASEIFDDAVNRGISSACKILCDTLKIPRVTYPDEILFNIIANYGKRR